MKEKLIGVNLGGWLVLEQWMRPALFKGLSGPDETVFSLEKENGKAVLQDHWDNFITKKDLIYLKSLGINIVRLPFPWWFEGEAPYFSSLAKLKEIIGWFEEIGLRYILDLHTAPGCQNGFDNGGITNVLTWHLKKENITLTIEKLVKIVGLFGNNPHYYGIEVLNEPGASIPLDIVQDFYLKTYQAIRKINKKAIVFHDAFRPLDPSWESFFKTHKFENYFFDLHIYYCFDHSLKTTPTEELLKNIETQGYTYLEKLSKKFPIIIGEWSLGFFKEHFENKSNEEKLRILKKLAELQLRNYAQVEGSFFWNYKIDNHEPVGWNFSQLVAEGIMPDRY